MTRDDALDVAAMVVNAWPGQEWTAAQLEAFVTGISDLDAAACTTAVSRLHRQDEWRPTLARVRAATYSVVKERAPEAWRELPPEPPPRPAWVLRWERARAAGDRRWFPEQVAGMVELASRGGLDAVAYQPPPEPTDDPQVWVQDHEYKEAHSGGHHGHQDEAAAAGERGAGGPAGGVQPGGVGAAAAGGGAAGRSAVGRAAADGAGAGGRGAGADPGGAEAEADDGAAAGEAGGKPGWSAD